MAELPAGFRVVPQASATAAPALPPGFRVAQQPTPEQPISAGLDVAESALSGLPRGVVETLMSPVSLARMTESGLGYVGEKGADLGAALGLTPLTDEERKQIREPSALTKPLYATQDKVRDYMNEKLHKPQTTAGKFAGTLTEFATPGGLPSKAARAAPGIAAKVGRYAEEALGNVVAPAVVSETAGQMTEGTPLEGPARFAGALAGNVGAAATRAHNAPESVIRRATDGTTDAQWAEAQRLQDNGMGIDLSSPEALSQARGGASKLTDLLRVVEGSTTGGNKTAPFFAKRPGQVDNAVGGVLDQIAPQSPQPSTLGPRASEAATNEIDQVRQGVNDQTRPLYKAAETQLIPDAEFATIQADPRFAAAYERLKNNPELPEYAALPPNSIAVVDAVTKDMAARGEALTNSANPLYGPELGAKQKTGAADARSVATQQSPEYAQALAEQERLRRTVLDPVKNGPVGQVAKAKDTVGASNAVLPHNPLSGSGPEAADAVQRLVRQDPETTAALVRQNLADRYSAAQTETQSGRRESAGAKFHKSVAGNDQRQEVLDAVIRALPTGPTAAPAMSKLLEILQATMRREGPGSATESNRMITSELGATSPVGKLIDIAKSLGSSFITQAGDATKRAQLRNNLGDLAETLTGPNAVQRTRAAADRRPQVSYPESVLRTLLESGQTLQDPRGSR